MFDLSLTELKSIAKNRNIKGYKCQDKVELLKALNILVKAVKEIDLSSLSLCELKLIAKFRRIKNYEDMSRDKLLDALKKSEPFKDTKELRKENRDDDKIIRDLRALYEPEEDYYKTQKVKSGFDDEYIKYESNGDKGKSLSTEEYLNMIRPYLSNIIDDHKDGWKIQLAAEVTFFSVQDSNESSTTHIHSENTEVYIGYETNNIIKEVFKSLLEEYQESLKTKIKNRFRF